MQADIVLQHFVGPSRQLALERKSMGLPSLNPSACIGKPVTIYALFDPRDHTAFYVGATSKNPKKRLSSHLNDSCHLQMKGRRYDVIRAIAQAGLRTEIETLEVAVPENWPEAEQFWIANLRFLGVHLTNIGIGGPGALGSKQSKETQQKRRDAQRGSDMSHLHTRDVWQRSADKRRGKPGKKPNAETRFKLSESHKGKKWTPEQRAKIVPKLRLPRRKTGKPARNRKTLVIDGVSYHGRPSAIVALGVSSSTISNWLRKGRARNMD